MVKCYWTQGDISLWNRAQMITTAIAVASNGTAIISPGATFGYLPFYFLVEWYALLLPASFQD